MSTTLNEIIRRYANPDVNGSQKTLRIRQDSSNSYSLSTGGAIPNGEPGNWISLTGITYDMLADLQGMIQVYLNQDPDA